MSSSNECEQRPLLGQPRRGRGAIESRLLKTKYPRKKYKVKSEKVGKIRKNKVSGEAKNFFRKS